MAESILDIPALTAPIAGENPAGSALPFLVNEDLKKWRKDDGDTKADWAAIVRVAKDTLTTGSKDLMVAARLTEALVKVHRFVGLRDGVRLLRELVEEGWERLRPEIEDGDVEPRAAPFNWLDDPDAGAFFPSTLRMTPLFASDKGACSCYDWQQANDPSPAAGARGADELKAIIDATPLESCDALNAELSQSMDELSRLALCLSTQMGPSAPAMLNVRQTLDDAVTLVRQVLRNKRQDSPADSDQLGEPNRATSAAASGSPGSRAEAYRQLKAAADVLQRLEPHSPIPYLVHRAVELGNLPFPKLIRALIRDENVIGELNRELGIKEADGTPPSES